MAKNRLAQQRSPELPQFPALNQQARRPVAPIQKSPRLQKVPQKQTLNERRRRVNPALHQPLPWNQLLVQLLLKRPLLLLLTFSGGILIVAGIAAIGLTRPEQGYELKFPTNPLITAISPTTESATETPESLPNPTPTTENVPVTTVTQQTEQNALLGLYLAIGAGCAVGAWLLYRRRLKLAAKMQRQLLPKILPGSSSEKNPEKEPKKQKNGKPLKRIAPGSRKPLVANPGKIPVADSIVRWPNGQNLPRNSQKVLTDTTAKRRKQSIMSDR